MEIKILSKYFKVPYSSQFERDKEVLRELITAIGANSNLGGSNSAFKKGLKSLAKATGASNREVKQLIQSNPEARARSIWVNCESIKRISKIHYVDILKQLMNNIKNSKIEPQLLHKIDLLSSFGLARKLSRAEYYGLSQVQCNISKCNQINKIKNSGEIASKLISEIDSYEQDKF